MNYRKRFVVEPGSKVRLGKIDPEFKDKHDGPDESAKAEIQENVERLAKAQYLLYAGGQQVTASGPAGAGRRGKGWRRAPCVHRDEPARNIGLQLRDAFGGSAVCGR